MVNAFTCYRNYHSTVNKIREGSKNVIFLVFCLKTIENFSTHCFIFLLRTSSPFILNMNYFNFSNEGRIGIFNSFTIGRTHEPILL